MIKHLVFIVGLSAVVLNTSWALPDPYAYLNYLQNLKTAINTAEQVQNQLKMIQFEVQNAKQVSDYQWRDTLNLLQQMDQATQQGRALSYSASQIDTQFRQSYPNYAQSKPGQDNYPQAYQTWNEASLNTFENTLRSAGMEASQLQQEQYTLTQLRRQGQTAQGRMQVLQVSTELAAENVNQLQALKRLMMAEANSQNAYRAYQVSKDSYREQGLKTLTENVKPQFVEYKNNPKLGEIAIH